MARKWRTLLRCLSIQSETITVCIPARHVDAEYEIPRPTDAPFDRLEPGHRFHAVCYLDEGYAPEPEKFEYDPDDQRVPTWEELTRG